MSSGWIMSSLGTCPSTQSVMAVATKPGHGAVTWMPSFESSLCSPWLQPDDAELRGRVGSEPALSVLAGDRRGVDDQRLPVLGARLLEQRDALARHQVRRRAG